MHVSWLCLFVVDQESVTAIVASYAERMFFVKPTDGSLILLTASYGLQTTSGFSATVATNCQRRPYAEKILKYRAGNEYARNKGDAQ